MPDLLESLKSGVVTVKFTKADGSERTMNATLSHSIIGNSMPMTGAPTRERINPSLLVVWDVDASGWRSIREDRIISWQDAA